MLLLRALLLAASGLDPDDFLVKATSMLGVDLHLSPAAARWFPYAVEVKNVESLNIWAALKQAADNADGKVPLLVFKRAGTGLHVALRLEDFLALHPCPNPSPATVVSPPAASMEIEPQP